MSFENLSNYTPLGSGSFSFSSEIASLGSETGSVTNGDTLLEALAKVNDRLPLSGGTLTGPITGTSGVIEQRNGVTTQISRLYNTYTDGSNYQGISLGFSGNIFQLQQHKAGTGGHLSASFIFQLGMQFQVGTSANHRYDLTSTGFGPTQWDNNLDLGNSSYRWRDLHLGRNAYFTGLPTADPAVAGQLWNNSGVLTVSAG